MERPHEARRADGAGQAGPQGLHSLGPRQVRGIGRPQCGMENGDRAHPLLVHPEIGIDGSEAPGVPPHSLGAQRPRERVRPLRIRPSGSGIRRRVQRQAHRIPGIREGLRGGQDNPCGALSRHALGVQPDIRFQPLPLRDRADPPGDRGADRAARRPGRSEGVQDRWEHVQLRGPHRTTEVPAALGQDPAHPAHHGSGPFAPRGQHDVPARPRLRRFREEDIQ